MHRLPISLLWQILDLWRQNVLRNTHRRINYRENFPLMPINHANANVYLVRWLLGVWGWNGSFKHHVLVSFTVCGLVGAVGRLECLHHLFLFGSGWPFKGNIWFCTSFAMYNPSAWVCVFCLYLSSVSILLSVVHEFKSGFFLRNMFQIINLL